MSPAYTRSDHRHGDPVETSGHFVRTAADWCMCEPVAFVRHAPTNTIFEIYAHPGLPSAGPVALERFAARLVHVYEDELPPGGAVLEGLRREALAMGLHYLGIVNRIESTSGCREDRCRQAHSLGDSHWEE